MATSAAPKKATKTATVKRAAKAPAQDKAGKAPAGGPTTARVRMYRQGLGDCFLLTFPKSDNTEFHMLIDCGVILGTPDPSAKMTAVVQDIIAATGGRLDLLVATHQHWDHLSGFLQASGLFAAPGAAAAGKLSIDALWLAWTEDPQNDLANKLRRQRSARKNALRAAVQGLRARKEDHSNRAALRFGLNNPQTTTAGLSSATHVEDLLDFFGAASGNDTEAALAAVRKYSKTPPRFCAPSDKPSELPAVPGVRVYVLGPPQDETLIKRSDPSKSHPEVYELAAGSPDAERAFFAAALNDPALDALRDLCFPFDQTCQIPVAQAQQDRFFQAHYYEGEVPADPQSRSGPKAPSASPGPGNTPVNHPPDASWRWIEDDWSDVATQLALQLDSDTNNTSLALAFEFVASGKVLLFPADAQVGNWMSWVDLTWDVNGKKAAPADLLRRTVLYKVGHHASHNATLREHGLELMESDELVALIPVDHEMAVKKRWNMPFPALLKRLLEKTRGRVLRVDDTVPLSQRACPPALTQAEWSAFQGRVTETPLYFELSLPL